MGGWEARVMDDPGITPLPPGDPDVRWLLAQRVHDLEALDVAADLIATLRAENTRLRVDRDHLLLLARREAHP